MNGEESDTRADNLAWSCRPCNVTVGNVMRRAGIGRVTCQYNPRAAGASSLGEYLSAVRILKGEVTGDVSEAVRTVHATSPDQRSEFASEIWRIRKERYGPSGRSGSVPF